MRLFLVLILSLSILVIYSDHLQANISFQDLNTKSDVVVLELFTSQSCSSCPPADKILESLSYHKDIIALGCHVTYWDHLHWKDTVSRDFCTKRQHAYANSYQSNRVFTPELRINGRTSMVGSSAHKIQTFLKQDTNMIIPIQIDKRFSGDYHMRALKLETDKKLAAYYILYDKKKTETMTRGENRGLTVSYVNAVSHMVPVSLETLSNQFIPDIIPMKDQEAIIVIQEDLGYGVGPIVAVGKLP